MRSDQREWDRLADADAMWAVHSEPSRRGSWSADAFFATGRAEVDGILAGLADQGPMPARRGAALDFGCGLGRLSRALAAHFDHVTGVDISTRMVDQARELNAGIPNLAFAVNVTDRLRDIETESFDLVLSLIALQHVSSPRVVEAYLVELARACAPGGTLVVQVPARVGWRIRLRPARVLNGLIRRSPVVPEAVTRRMLTHSMRLIAVPEARVRSALERAGLEVVAAFPDGRTGSDAAPSLAYIARRAWRTSACTASETLAGAR